MGKHTQKNTIIENIAAACLVIKNLNPPIEPYRPGASSGNPPIHRPYRGADMTGW